MLTGAGSVFPGEVEAPQHLQERRVRGGLRGGAGTVPHLQLHLVLVLLVLLVLEPARGPPRAPPPPPREGVGDAPGLLHGPARHGAGTAPPLPGTGRVPGRDPPLPGTSGRDPPLPVVGRKGRCRAGEPATGTLGHCHRHGGPGPPPLSAPPGCPRVLSPPQLSPPPPALSPPQQFLSPPSQCSLLPLALSPPQLCPLPSGIVTPVTVPITSGTVTTVVLSVPVNIVTPIPALPVTLDAVTPLSVPISPQTMTHAVTLSPAALSHSVLWVIVCPSSACPTPSCGDTVPGEGVTLQVPPVQICLRLSALPWGTENN